jgi:bifunctional DNA primase/polymerase-like protein/AAA domain-containing protein/primase-like protein
MPSKKQGDRSDREPNDNNLPKILYPSRQRKTAPVMSGVLAAALSYLKRGWRPIPIVPRGKNPLLTTWQEYQQRSPTESEVTQWFAQWPDANVALLMGQGSGLIAVDIDSSEGEEAFRALCGDVRTLTNLTSKGRHLLFRHPGFGVRNAVKALPGIDLRGDGGYILVQPSIHPSGHPYRWAEAGAELLDGSKPLPLCPQQLLDALKKNDQVSVIADVVPQGERNNTLTSLAGSMRHRGASYEAMVAALRAENSARCKPPLLDSEVVGIATSISKYAPGEMDSVHQGSLRVRKEFRPRLIGEWLADPDGHEDADWILKGYLAHGNLTLLSGHPKAGKTTFAAHLAVAVARGSVLLNRLTSQCPVLWLDLEQHLRHTKAMFRGLDADRLPIFLHSAPVWDFSLGVVGEFITEQQIGLVVVDSLSRLWRLADENDAVQVVKETRELMSLARQSNAAFLLIHHLRKSGGSQGLDARGSGALAAAVDISVQFRQESESSTRLLESQSRYEGTPGRLYTELQADKYIVYDNEQEVHHRDQRAKILAVLTDYWLLVEEIAELAGLPVGTTRPVLSEMYEEGIVERQGKGVRGDPFQYQHLKGRQEAFSFTPSQSGVAPQQLAEERDSADMGDFFELAATPAGKVPGKFCSDTIVGCRSERPSETRNPPSRGSEEAGLEQSDDAQ